MMWRVVAAVNIGFGCLIIVGLRTAKDNGLHVAGGSWFVAATLLLAGLAAGIVAAKEGT